MKIFQKKVSLLSFLSFITVLAVSTVIFIHSTYSYFDVKNNYHEETKNNVQKSAIKLSKNIAPLITAYQVNDYLKLIETELLLNKYVAIIIQDNLYAEILGQKNNKDGYLLHNNEIELYSKSLKENIDNLSSSYYIYSEPIVDDTKNVLGSIAIYASDSKLNNRLAELIQQNILDALLIIIVLVILLHLLMRLVYVTPLYKIILNLQDSDEFGIPKNRLDDSKFIEISLLVNKINKMLETIRSSKIDLAKINQKLTFEKERFQLAIDGTRDGMWDWNLKTDAVIHSDRFETMLGYNVGELPDTIEAWDKLLHPDDKKEAYKKVEEYLKSLGTKTYENTFRMKAKDGSWVWITGRGKAIFDSDGTPLRFVGFNTDVTTQINHAEELEHISRHDILTSLANRYELNDQLSKSISLHLRSGHKLAVLFIDLDGFKEINDTYGHDAGDHVLITIANRMKNITRNEDIIARLGGDEFVIVLTNFDNYTEIDKYTYKLLEEIQKTVACELDTENVLQVTSSIGITFFSKSNNVGSDALIRQADQAMYKAKNSGKNRFEFFDIEEANLTKAFQEKRKSFLDAIKNNELEVYYQAKVNLKTKEVVAFESLIRWNHPQKGLITPVDFLDSLLHDIPAMRELDIFVLDSSIKQLSQWLKDGRKISVSVNVTTHRFITKEFQEDLDEIMSKYPNVSAEFIELEILESTILENMEKTVNTIKHFNEKGFSVALDDYGTAYSSLTYLKELPVNALKIDKSFVIDLFNDEANQHIVEGSVALAKAFNIHTVAEGVETLEHVEFLQSLGCEFAQGYFFAKPLPASKLKF
ncbi:MAG: EAL domain-containing protein [Campylobacterota bacterium]